jgi:uncharacterized protein (TIGR02145 family)
LFVAVVAVALATGGIKVLADVIASFAVAEPDKTVNVTRGNSVDSTSTVTVSDPDAIDGYLIKAKLSADIAIDFTVQIWSDASTFCSEASKCVLTTADQPVYNNLTDSATQEPADEITFNVRINANISAQITQHDIYVDYNEVNITGLQAFSTAKCNAMEYYSVGNFELDLIDMRDDKYYKIRRLDDGNCWMVDNLALAGSQTLESALSDIDNKTYALGAVANPNGSSPCNSLNTTDFPQRCGYHYYWAYATAGSTITSGDAPNSVCPKNWRLPVYGEYTTLRTVLNWGTGTTSGDKVVNSVWRGLRSGGNMGNYWTATANGNNAYELEFDTTVWPDYSRSKTGQYAVRCLAR